MKTKTKKKSKPVEEVLKSAPTVQVGTINLTMSKEELNTLINLMTISAKTFETLAIRAAQEDDKSSFDVFAARQKLSNLYVSRLVASMTIGEPDSREYH